MATFVLQGHSTEVALLTFTQNSFGQNLLVSFYHTAQQEGPCDLSWFPFRRSEAEREGMHIEGHLVLFTLLKPEICFGFITNATCTMSLNCHHQLTFL